VTVWFLPVCVLAHSQRGQVQPEIKHDVSPPFRSLKPHLANRIPIVAAESEEAKWGQGSFFSLLSTSCSVLHSWLQSLQAFGDFDLQHRVFRLSSPLPTTSPITGALAYGQTTASETSFYRSHRNVTQKAKL
jgi:hypothetical protein